MLPIFPRHLKEFLKSLTLLDWSR